VFVKNGQVTVADDVNAITSLYSLGHDALIDLRASSNFSPNIFMVYLGRVVNERAFNGTGQLFVAGGYILQQGKLVDGTDLLIDGGICVYQPSVDISTDNPDGYLLSGMLDLSRNHQALNFTNVVIGPDMKILGDLLGGGGFPPGSGIEIDLREPNP